MRSKRAFDVAVVVAAAIVWLPVLALAALAVLLFSGRPVSYRSRRWVRPGDAITMLKLRVMVPDADQTTDCVDGDPFLSTVPGSSLYTGVGRLLDRLGLNEIPQFVHVLRGEMSLVGPRPLTEKVRDALLEVHGDIDQRWLASPAGLTGLPQLVGRAALTDRERLELEFAYSAMVSEDYRVRIDFMILLYTVLVTFGFRKPLDTDAALRLLQRRRSRITLLTEPTDPTTATAPGDGDIDIAVA